MARKAYRRVFLFLGDDQELADWACRALRRRWRNTDMVRVGESGDIEGSLRNAAPELVFVSPSPRAGYLRLMERVRCYSEVPIIVLLRDTTDTDKYRALACGADDCVACPGDASELLARTRAVLRRAMGQGFWPVFSAGV